MVPLQNKKRAQARYVLHMGGCFFSVAQRLDAQLGTQRIFFRVLVHLGNKKKESSSQKKKIKMREQIQANGGGGQR